MMTSTTPAYKIAQINAMIVDDHPPIRKVIRRVLSDMGVKNIVECADGVEALKHLNFPVDLVICDIYMNRMDGFQVLSFIRNRPVASDIPVLIVSGDTSRDVIVKASDWGADAYVMKPFQSDDLETRISQVLAQFFSPSPVLKLLRHGDKLLLSKQIDQALKTYILAETLDPNSARVRYSLANALSLCGKRKEAVQILNKNILDNPSYYRSYMTLADIYLQLNKKTEAKKMILKELELHSLQPERQMQLANLLLLDGENEEAIEHYRTALKADPKNKDALLGLGRTYAAMENADKALHYFKRLRRYYPNDSQTLEEAFKWAIPLNQVKKVESILQVDRHQPNKIANFVQLARLYLNTDRLTEAQAALSDIFKLDPESIEGFKIQALIQTKIKNFAAACSSHRKVLAKEVSVPVCIAYAECLQRLGKTKDSIVVLHKALPLAPQDPQILFLLGRAFHASRQFLKAFYIFRAAKSFGLRTESCQKGISASQKEALTRRG
ncbi:MAG: tetratricopeptide repeat protein [Oligoflexales bacterium]|nr:tetratricopeptide repeat protein [Oligoflexales bacterium]